MVAALALRARRAPLYLALLVAAPTVARAEVPAPVAVGRVRGQVFERGSLTPLAGARIVTPGGETASHRRRRPLQLTVAPGGHRGPRSTTTATSRSRVTEKLAPARALAVEYRLLPLPAYRKRYESTVRGEARHEGERFTLRDEELHQTAGHARRSVPRHRPAARAWPRRCRCLPIYVIRGASPGMNGFFLDGMRVPQLFHFSSAAASCTRAWSIALDFYPGAYDVSLRPLRRRHHRRRDAARRAPTRQPRRGRAAPLRRLGAASRSSCRAASRVEVAGPLRLSRRPHPRLRHRASTSATGTTSCALDWRGAHRRGARLLRLDLTIQPTTCRAGHRRTPAMPTQLQRLEFHRVQLRERAPHRPRRARGGARRRLRRDRRPSAAPACRSCRSAGAPTRASRWKRFRLVAGIDGELSRFTAANFDDHDRRRQPDAARRARRQRATASWPAPSSRARVEIVDAAPVGHRRRARRRLPRRRRSRCSAIDPRFQLRAKLLPRLQHHRRHRPLPAAAELSRSRCRASTPSRSSSACSAPSRARVRRRGEAARRRHASGSPASTSSSTTSTTSVLDFAPPVCTSPPPESLTGLAGAASRARSTAQSYGMELLLRKHAGRFTGWIAYTLSRSERIYSCGLRPADFDQTHVLNVVAQVRLPWNLMAGGAPLRRRPGGRSRILEPPDGTLAPVRNNARLPDYVQLDLRLDREWIFKQLGARGVPRGAQPAPTRRAIFGIAYPDGRTASRATISRSSTASTGSCRRSACEDGSDARRFSCVSSRSALAACSYTFDGDAPEAQLLGEPPDMTKLPRLNNGAGAAGEASSTTRPTAELVLPARAARHLPLRFACPITSKEDIFTYDAADGDGDPVLDGVLHHRELAGGGRRRR